MGIRGGQDLSRGVCCRVNRRVHRALKVRLDRRGTNNRLGTDDPLLIFWID